MPTFFANGKSCSVQFANDVAAMHGIVQGEGFLDDGVTPVDPDETPAEALARTEKEIVKNIKQQRRRWLQDQAAQAAVVDDTGELTDP